eukprot:CAMPEP_0196669372 /NCGR_PEP_ID=MMETSP1090-20130531/583_1 /TAXON_ID=37098 /ORGANISM="Isochrysis sp, Strain CCMP1244" /LENGTH=68 /DNA_ID=CAMNT_0042006897 /DNA_START=288 /DNA_END=490 /DNA_ORIENTATION=-
MPSVMSARRSPTIGLPSSGGSAAGMLYHERTGGGRSVRAAASGSTLRASLERGDGVRANLHASSIHSV